MHVDGLLLDLEGVLYQDDKPVPGVASAIKVLKKSHIEIRYLTNTTTQPRRLIVDRLIRMGFDLTSAQVFTPGIAAARLLKQQQVERLHLAAPAPLAEDFSDFRLVDDNPQVIVLGDLHREFSWNRLNALFQMARQGARIVALHKNRYCRRGKQIALDLGPFVAALEFANGITATVVGKPTRLFFKLALEDLDLEPAKVAMVGDDIEVDIGGAQQIGMPAIQVKTGKFMPKDIDHPSIQPDLRIDSAADLPNIFFDR